MLSIRQIYGGLANLGETYLISGEKECYIVDPTCDDLQWYDAFTNSSKVKGVILTHCHIDHMLYARNVADHYNVPVIAHKSDKLLALCFPIQVRLFFGKQKPENLINKPLHIDQYIEDNDILKLDEDEIHVIHTPGHTPGSIMLYMPSIKSLISGDNIFRSGGVGRTDFPLSNPKDFKESIAKILKLPSDTRVYSGHASCLYSCNAFTIADWYHDTTFISNKEK